MTVDIATLGLQVRSDGVVTANDRLRRLQGEGRQAEQSTRRLDQSMRGLSQRARMLRGALATLGVGLSLRGIQNMVTQTAEWSATLVDTAENLGLTTTELQRYRAAAEDSTVETRTLDSGLNRLNRRLGEARQGSGQLADVYEELGLEGMNTQEAFLAIADAVSEADDSSEAARLGYAAFGRQVEDLLPLLRHGRDGIGDLGDEAERSGRVMDQSLARRGAEAATQLNRINSTLQTSLRGGLLSGFAEGMGDIEEVISSSEFQEAMEFFGTAIGQVANFAGEAVVQVGALVAMLRDPSLDNLADLGVLGMIRRQIGGAEASEPDASTGGSDEPNFIVEIREARGHVPPDIEQVLTDAHAAAERYNQALGRSEQIGQQAGIALSSGFEEAIFGADSLTESLGNISEELARIILRAQVLEPLGQSLGTGIGAVFSPGAAASPGLSDFTGIDVSGLDFLNTQSFAGGGYTGNGPRSGGLDGMGGFPAILHPQETVVDHTRGSGGDTFNISMPIDARGADESAARNLRREAERIKQDTIRSIQERQQRRGRSRL